ncbi:transglycosylase SLT domain-containing protein [Nannocystaceae bacterium ST9]
MLSSALLALVAFGSDGCVAAGPHEVSLAPEPIAEPAELEPVALERRAEPELDVEPERAPAWTPPDEPILAGIEGAGQWLARGRPEAALDHLIAQLAEPEYAPPERETPRWFRAGAIAGRAHLRLGHFDQAVAALEPRLASKLASRHLPIDLVGYELARARIAWAKSGALEREAADAQLELAIRELGKLRKLQPDRIGAALRVAQGEAMAAIRGGDAKASKRAAIEADDALGRLIVSFPNHPALGQWMLDQALARERAGKPVDAAAALRRIHIERAGEPEAAQAWVELERLAAAHPKKIGASPLSTREQLDAGQYARTLRRLDRSRELLEAVWTDPEQPRHLHREAGHSLAWTQHKQFDHRGCAEVLAELYAAVPSIETRDELTRCYERAGMVDEAVGLWVDVYAGSKSTYGATALWTAIDQALLGGRYARADELLKTFEAKYKSHAQERRWLHAWLPLRLGDREAARKAFAELVEGRQDGSRERAARYFLGKLELGHADREIHLQGVHRLQTLAGEADVELQSRGVSGGFVLYYGLLARERLREAGEDPGPVPELAAIEWEQRWIGHAEQLELLARASREYGDAFPSLIRAEQLFAIGWPDEASRELRVAADEYINARSTWEGSEMPGGRSESLRAGLAWAPEWNSVKASASRAARKRMRDETERAAMRELFMQLVWATPEPYEFAKLTASDYPYRTRWHLRAYREPIERHAWEREVDPHHLWSLMYTESRFRRHVVSHVGARGALQIMPWTGRQLVERLGELEPGGRFDPDVLFEIETNSRLAAYYIDELLVKFHGQPVFAYASYNGGPSNVARWLVGKSSGPTGIGLDEFVEEIPFSETANYARRVMEVHATYELMYRGRLPAWPNDVDPVVEDNIAF